NNWRPIGGTFPVGAPVTAIAKSPDSIDLFITGNNGVVYTEWWLQEPSSPVNVSATQTQLGPDVCVAGREFVPGGTARATYFGIPGRTAPLSAGGFDNVKPDGSFKIVDTTNEGRLVQCNSTQIDSTVTINVTETDSNGVTVRTGSDTMPGAYWCAN